MARSGSIYPSSASRSAREGGGDNDSLLVSTETTTDDDDSSHLLCRFHSCGYIRCILICGVIALLLCFTQQERLSSSTLMTTTSSNRNGMDRTSWNSIRKKNKNTKNSFTIQSWAFEDDTPLPSKYHVAYSPPLTWSNAPIDTQSYALIVEDIDRIVTNIFKHWIVYNIPSNLTGIDEGIQMWPNSTMVLRNDYTRTRYDGPFFTPKDDRKHRYVFHLFALNVTHLVLSSSKISYGKHIYSYEDLYGAMAPYILQEATLTGTYNNTL
jgi:Raf kinase inhibitor-like YbhB/YbcL family protein